MASTPDVYILEGHSEITDPPKILTIPDGIVFITAAVCGISAPSYPHTVQRTYSKFVMGEMLPFTTPFVEKPVDPTFDVFYNNPAMKELLQSSIPTTPEGKHDYREKLKEIAGSSSFNVKFPGETTSEGFLYPFAAQYDAKDHHIYARHSGITQLYTDAEYDPTMRTLRSGELDAVGKITRLPLDTLTIEDIAPLFEFSFIPRLSDIEKVIFFDKVPLPFFEVHARFHRLNINFSYLFSNLFKTRENPGAPLSTPAVIIQPACRIIRHSSTPVPLQRQLSAAANSNFIQRIKINSLLHTRFENGNTYLMDYLQEERDVSLTLQILNRVAGVDPVQRKEYINFTNPITKATALQLAVNNNRHDDIILKLIELNADFLQLRFPNGNTYLMAAIETGRKKIALAVLQKLEQKDSAVQKAYVNYTSITNKPALQLAVDSNGDIEIIRKLLEAGSDFKNLSVKPGPVKRALELKRFDILLEFVKINFKNGDESLWLQSISMVDANQLFAYAIQQPDYKSSLAEPPDSKTVVKELVYGLENLDPVVAMQGMLELPETTETWLIEFYRINTNEFIPDKFKLLFLEYLHKPKFLYELARRKFNDFKAILDPVAKGGRRTRKTCTKKRYTHKNRC